jgi:hypothetical protein
MWPNLQNFSVRMDAWPSSTVSHIDLRLGCDLQSAAPLYKRLESEGLQPLKIPFRALILPIRQDLSPLKRS